MKCEIDLDKNPSYKAAFKAIIEYSEMDAYLSFTQDGMSMRVMDQANIAAMKLTTRREYYTTYEVEGEERILIHTGQLSSLLKTALKQGVLAMQSTTDLLTITSTIKGKVRTYTLRLLEPGVTDVKDINPDYEGEETKVSYDDFKTAIDDVSVIEESVILHHKDAAILIKSKGTTTTAETAIPASVMKEAKGQFNPEYIQKMLPSISDTITLRWKKDMPLVMIQETPCVCLTGVIAPRVNLE